ncbi:MAG: DUF6046 domain-containing protein [Tannerella sp.]|jgi:hypothetical protein|nr:DUF6046 domain-containing protein [Tannerella sp.]
MISTANVINLVNLYREYFGNSPYLVQYEPSALPDASYGNVPPRKQTGRTQLGEALTSETADAYGHEVFLPVEFFKSNTQFLTLKCCTVRITSKKTIIRTAVAERIGTVKEQFSTGDWEISIKGVLIAENRQFPDDKILKLKELYETTDEVELYNAMTGLFMLPSKRIVISSIEFPDVQGKNNRHRPFEMSCESDFVETLIVRE